MIPECYQVSAVPADGGERVAGYLFKPNAPLFDHNFGTWIIDETAFNFLTWLEGSRASVALNLFEIDPATVEPVRVKIKYEYGEYRCPNCNAWFVAVNKNDIDNGRFSELTPFCGNCGMAIDWSE